jgi:hypothetical protein
MQETPHLATLQLCFHLGGQGGELLSVLHRNAMQIHHIGYMPPNKYLFLS